jgi:acyl-CoA synthetase (AMP-forming)/AMP-acid ligase II
LTYIADRKKDMILSGGQNIYPTDIESVMREQLAVAEVAVIGIASERWGETPLAMVVLHSGHTMVATELLEWTNARVGKQRRVSGVVWRESLPRNPNGKVLKRELRREYASSAANMGKAT